MDLRGSASILKMDKKIRETGHEQRHALRARAIAVELAFVIYIIDRDIPLR